MKYGVFYSRLYSSGCFLKNEPQSVFVVRGVDVDGKGLHFL